MTSPKSMELPSWTKSLQTFKQSKRWSLASRKCSSLSRISLSSRTIHLMRLPGNSRRAITISTTSRSKTTRTNSIKSRSKTSFLSYLLTQALRIIIKASSRRMFRICSRFSPKMKSSHICCRYARISTMTLKHAKKAKSWSLTTRAKTWTFLFPSVNNSCEIVMPRKIKLTIEKR